MNTVDTSNITLCLTIGKRPELLRQTLNSLFQYVQFAHVIAINDFRDEETNAVFRELCPSGILISLPEQVGHHKAVDTMYAQVNTDYVFHCEDDWLFDRPVPVQQSIQLLQHDSNISLVCFRKVSDIHHTDEQKKLIQVQQTADMPIIRIDHLHEQWHGYSFNPHLAPLVLWQEIGGFSQFKKERHISRFLRAKSKYMVHPEQAPCHHIGEENSVANPPKENWLKKISTKIFG